MGVVAENSLIQSACLKSAKENCDIEIMMPSYIKTLKIPSHQNNNETIKDDLVELKLDNNEIIKTKLVHQQQHQNNLINIFKINIYRLLVQMVACQKYVKCVACGW